jgi:hypothetical protein
MSDTLSLLEQIHTPDKVLADLRRILSEEPERARDGIVVILLDKGADGEAYDPSVLASDMRRMDVVALLTFAIHNQIERVRAL